MRVDVGGYELFVQAHQQPKARTAAVLLHGLAGTHSDWDHVLPAFERRADAYAVDLIGHGRSDKPDASDAYRFDAVGETFVRLADHLGLDRPVWVGYSLGARLLLHFALQHPERVGGLVLVSVHPGHDSHHQHARRMRQDRDDADVLDREGLDAFLERWHRRPVFDTRRKHTQRWAREVERKRTTNDPKVLARCMRGLGVGAQEFLLERAQLIDAPTLLVAGVLDPTYVEFARALHERIQRSRLELHQYAGHAVHLEDTAGFNERLGAFLDHLAPPPAPAPKRAAAASASKSPAPGRPAGAAQKPAKPSKKKKR